MKKIIAVCLVIVSLISLVACSNNAENNTLPNSKTTMLDTTVQETSTQKSKTSMNIKINDKSFTAQFYDNETAKAFADMLPLTIKMEELHGNEKYYYFNSSLPMNSSNIGKINTGDIMLYGSNCLVLFYKDFSTSYSYTKIGYIENPSGLADAVGSEDVTITFA